MGWKVSGKEIHEFVEKYGDIPKVLISSQDPDFVTVNYDNETGIREAIDYLVNVNGFTSICMLGGEDYNHDALDRKEIFRLNSFLFGKGGYAARKNLRCRYGLYL